MAAVAWQPSGAARRWMTRWMCAGYADGKLLVSLLPLRAGRIFPLARSCISLRPRRATPVSVNRRVGAGWRQIRYGRSLVCPILDGSSLLLTVSLPLREDLTDGRKRDAARPAHWIGGQLYRSTFSIVARLIRVQCASPNNM